VEVVASLSQGRTAAAQCGLFTHKSVPVIFEPPCITPVHSTSLHTFHFTTLHITSLIYTQSPHISPVSVALWIYGAGIYAAVFFFSFRPELSYVLIPRPNSYLFSDRRFKFAVFFCCDYASLIFLSPSFPSSFNPFSPPLSLLFNFLFTFGSLILDIHSCCTINKRHFFPLNLLSCYLNVIFIFVTFI